MALIPTKKPPADRHEGEALGSGAERLLGNDRAEHLLHYRRCLAVSQRLSITTMNPTPGEQTRRYDSPLRREQMAGTRERIVEAGAVLVHHQSSWDWRELTVRAVAREAGVHERTVHRHFATEREMRAAVLQRLLEESGVRVEVMKLADLPAHVDQLFDYLGSFPNTTERQLDPVLDDLDGRRKAAICSTVAAEGAALSKEDQRLAAAMLDVLWGLPSYQRLIGGWGFESAAAARGVSWVIGLMTEAIREGRGPDASA